jgi:predicted permease
MFEPFINFRLRVKALLHRRQLDRDLEEELSFHLSLREANHQASGIGSGESHTAARREFGNVTAFQEACRDMWTFVSLENLWQDVRFAARTLRKEPGFTAMAVLSLALGMGANTAVFTIVNDLLLKTIPVEDPANLASFGKAEGDGVQGGISGSIDLFPYEFYQRVASRADVFQGICSYGSFPIGLNVRQSGSSGPTGQATGALVSGDFFSVLGVNTVLGRPTSPADTAAPGSQPVAVISYDYWQQNFSGDPSVVGRSMLLNGTIFTVIGVAPRNFYGITLDSRPPDMWLPVTMQEQAMRRPSMLGRGDPYWLHMMGRLQPGVSVARAQEWIKLELRRYMLDSEGAGITADRRQAIEKSYVELLPGGRGVSYLRGQYAEPLRILMGVVGLVLLIACANLANFFLAKMAAREREIATRLALGAGASRIVRQMLTEALLVSFLGGAVGLLFAAWGTRALLHFVVAGSTRTPFNPNPDLRVVAFTFGASLLTGLLFGLAPAWRAARMNLTSGLRANSRSVAGGGGRIGRFGFSKILVIAQVALSLVLLVGAGLFVRTLRNLKDQSFGFNQSNLLYADLDIRLAGYKAEQLNGLYDRLLVSLRSLPGVRSASMSAVPPFIEGSWNLYISRHGQTAPSASDVLSSINAVTPEYFEASGTRMIGGRAFVPQDTANSSRVVILNQAMASRFFPRGDALGQHIVVAGDFKNEREVVGIAQDGKYKSPRETSEPMVFLPLRQLSGEDLFASCLLVRTIGDPAQVAGELRAALARIDSSVPILKVTTLTAEIDRSMAREVLISRLSAFFSLLALLLACIGLYGVMSFNVVRRANEIGIRTALGAQSGAVLWMVFRETLVLLALGIAIGVPVTVGATTFVQSQLFGLSSSDPATIAVALAAIVLVTVIAGYVPARRAAKTDPLLALRYE